MAFPQRKRTPSFSSSVLDSIYRSIDESDGFHTDIKVSISSYNEKVSSSSSSSASWSSSSPPPNRNDDKLTTLRGAIMDDEHWLSSRTNTTTTTNSSCFSSSEAESYQAKRRSRKLADQGNTSSEQSQKIKITSVLDNDRLISKSNNDKNIKAVKLHEELKKPKQHMSPRARLTSFLNSIFQSNVKKVKLCSVGKTTDVKSTSSSKSCFNRTRYTTTDDDNNNNNCNIFKTSVRLYPVRVTVDGDCRDSIYNNITRKKKTIQEFTGKKSVQKVTSLKEENKAKKELTCMTRKIGLKNYVTSRRNEDEEDVWSYSSSDLFELPVYETTDFKTNQAIARGLRL